MYQISYKLYFFLSYQYKKYNLQSNKILECVLKLITGTIYHTYNYIMPKYYSIKIFKKYGLNNTSREKKITVSLTSFPGRIDTVWIVIESIMRQKDKADRIILWLAKEQFSDIEKLPHKLREQINRGLEIKFCDDIKSYKKFYYTIREFKKDNIITIDDDMFYPRDMITKLLKLHYKYPNNIICSSAWEIDDNYKIEPSKWKTSRMLNACYNSNKLGINSGAGTLFPPNALSERAFIKEDIKNLCPTADDLWLTVHSLINNTRISCIKYQPYPFVIKSSQEQSLYKINNCNSSELNNDKQWLNLINFYEHDIDKMMINN